MATFFNYKRLIEIPALKTNCYYIVNYDLGHCCKSATFSPRVAPIGNTTEKNQQVYIIIGFREVQTTVKAWPMEEN